MESSAMPTGAIAASPSFSSQDILDATESEDFAKQWTAHENQRHWFLKFNIWAFLFGPLWFVYRKAYLTAAITWVAGFIVAVIASAIVLFLNEAATDSQLSTVEYLVEFILVRPVVGCLANGLYFRKTLKLIQKANRLAISGEERSNFLKKRGGTNEAAAIVLLILSIASSYFLGAVGAL